MYANVRNQGVRKTRPEMLVPFAQMPWTSPLLAVRGRGNPDMLSYAIALTVKSVDANLPLSRVKTMSQILNTSLAGDRATAALFTSFAVLALLLAAAGVYGVMSFVVTQRTHEIGLRMALGADRGQVLRSTLRDGIRLALIGAAFGLAGAVLAGRLVASLVYKVGKLDWPSLAAALAILLLAALLGCWLPARRATEVDPMVALRQN